MQDEINEKVVALSVKGAKLTAEMLQKAIKAMLAQAKKQQEKQPHGKQTLKQLAKQNAGLSNIEITEGKKIRYRLCPKERQHRNAAPLSCIFQGAGRGRSDRSL